jgi:uncharacterized phiE125 gp8 family phage protein
MRAQKPERVTAPAADILTLAEVKEFLRLEQEAIDEDAILTLLIKTAAQLLDGYSGLLGRALITQEWRQKFDDFPDDRAFAFGPGPVQSVTELVWLDEAGNEQSFTDWHLVERALGPQIELKDGASWPTPATRPDAVQLAWVAGYGEDAEAVPEQVRLAALLLVAHLFEHRAAVSEGATVAIPLGLQQIIFNAATHGDGLA